MNTPAPIMCRRHYGVVTDRYKLVYFYEPDMNYWELFDLQKDPHELQSVFSEPEYAGRASGVGEGAGHRFARS